MPKDLIVTHGDIREEKDCLLFCRALFNKRGKEADDPTVARKCADQINACNRHLQEI